MIHDFTFAKEELLRYHRYCDNIGYRRAIGVGRRTGNSDLRNNLSEYEYIRTAVFYKNNEHMKEVKRVTSAMNVWDNVLVYYILQLQPGDFLDTQDYWIEWVKQNKLTKPIGKFLSVALTDNNTLTIEGTSHTIPQYHAIEFSPMQLHSIPEVKDRETWAVFMIGNYVSVSDKIIYR
jgi:hypothetical protein